MTARSSRWLLWLGLAAMLPLPILFIAPGWVPAGRLLWLGGISAAVMAWECSGGVVGLLALALLGQAFVYLLLLWLVAWGLSRLAGRLPRRALAAVTVGALAAGLLTASSFEVYRTPFAADAARGNLLHVYR